MTVDEMQRAAGLMLKEAVMLGICGDFLQAQEWRELAKALQLESESKAQRESFCRQDRD